MDEVEEPFRTLFREPPPPSGVATYYYSTTRPPATSTSGSLSEPRQLTVQDEAEAASAKQWTRLQPTFELPTQAAASQVLHEMFDTEAGARDATRGILYGTLTASTPSVSGMLFRHLCCCTRDGHAFTVSELVALALARYPSLAAAAKGQLLWLLGQLIGVRVRGADRVALALLRHVGTGDLSTANLWLADNLCSLLQRHLAWLLECPSLLRAVLLGYLRLAIEHGVEGDGAMRARRERELALCGRLWSGRPDACLQLGRDLLVAVHQLRGASEPLANAWQSLVRAEEAAHDGGGGGGSGSPPALGPLGTAPLPADLLSRVTPEAERDLRFLLSEIELGQERRHLEWFGARHLAGRNQAVVHDLLRWLCAGETGPEGSMSQPKLAAGPSTSRWWSLPSEVASQKAAPEAAQEAVPEAAQEAAPEAAQEADPPPQAAVGEGESRRPRRPLPRWAVAAWLLSCRLPASRSSIPPRLALLLDLLGYADGATTASVEPAAAFLCRPDGVPPPDGTGAPSHDSRLGVARVLLDAIGGLVPGCADAHQAAACRAVHAAVRVGAAPRAEPLLELLAEAGRRATAAPTTPAAEAAREMLARAGVPGAAARAAPAPGSADHAAGCAALRLLEAMRISR